MRKIVQAVVIVLLYAAAAISTANLSNAGGLPPDNAPDPLNAAYGIGGKVIMLRDGSSTLPAAPGSAMKIRTSVWGRPVVADLDSDGDEDAALILVFDPGGSGTFYRAAVAVNADGGFRGTNTVLLGDRIIPVDIRIRNGLIIIDYKDRPPGAPFSASPSVMRTTALEFQNGKLVEVASSEDTVVIKEGLVTIGHEVRSFRPCDGTEEWWLMGTSPALKEIKDVYRKELPTPQGYRPLLMVLAGKTVNPPADGFGADYPGAFLADRLLRTAPGETCEVNDSSADTPASNREKITIDLAGLDRDGLYGPPGAKRALSYEFCIPDSRQKRSEVKRIDPTVTFYSESPGRIGCGSPEVLCIGSTHQEDFERVLHNLTELPYVIRIDESFFE